MGDPVRVYADYGTLAVFDSSRRLGAEGGYDLDDLRRWFKARALVAWVDEQDEYTVRVAGARTELDGLPQDRGEIELKGPMLEIGSIEGLDEETETLSVALPAGKYAVTVAEEGDRAYVVHLEPIRRFAGRPRYGPLEVGQVRREQLVPVPVLTQLETTGPALSRLLARIGVALRGCSELTPATYVVAAGEAWQVPDARVDLADADVLVSAEPVGVWRRAPPVPEGAVVRYARAVAADVDRGRPVGLRAALVDGALTGVALSVDRPLTERDAAECLALASAAWDGGSAAILRDAAPDRTLSATMEWEDDRLVVRVGPLPTARMPRIRVELEGPDGEVLESVEAPALRCEDGHAVYEIWLLGRRAGCRGAAVAVLP